MTLLNGLKKTEDASADAEKNRKKRPDELLSSVVHETATPAAVEMLKENTAFTLPSGTAWALLVLDASRIGGLSKRQRRDEAKGSIIEHINNDAIATVATSEMLDDGKFGIIPNEGTLDRMDEFGLLTNASYNWGIVYLRDGALEIEIVADGSFQDAADVVMGGASLKVVLGEAAWAKHSGEGTGADEDDDVDLGAVTVSPDTGLVPTQDVEGDDELFARPAGAAEFSDAPRFDVGDALDDAPDFGDALEDPVDFDTDIDIDAEDELEVEAAPVFDVPPVGSYAEERDEEDDEIQDESAVIFAGEDEPFEVVDASFEPEDQPAVLAAQPLAADQTQVRSTLARRFLSEDLDLQVKLDEFLTTFDVGALSVRIDVPKDSSSWLGDQIAQLTRQANAQLQKLHTDNEKELQAEFVGLMGLHAEQVIHEVAVDREGSIYKKLMTGAKDEHRGDLDSKEERIRLAQSEIAVSFEATIKQIGQQAATQAEVQYRERNKARIQREQIDAAAALEADIQNRYDGSKREIRDLRRKDADRKMAIGTTRIFEVLSERQQEHLKGQRELMVELTQEIQRVIDENRTNDLSRTEALQREQATFDRVAALQAEHATVIDRVKLEAEDRLRRTESEFDAARQLAITEAAARDQDWQHKLDLANTEKNAQGETVRSLLRQLDDTEKSFEARTNSRIATLTADRDDMHAQLKLANEMQKRSDQTTHRNNRLLPFFIGTAGLVTIAAGFIVGAIVF